MTRFARLLTGFPGGGHHRHIRPRHLRANPIPPTEWSQHCVSVSNRKLAIQMRCSNYPSHIDSHTSRFPRGQRHAKERTIKSTDIISTNLLTSNRLNSYYCFGGFRAVPHQRLLENVLLFPVSHSGSRGEDRRRRTRGRRRRYCRRAIDDILRLLAFATCKCECELELIDRVAR